MSTTPPQAPITEETFLDIGNGYPSDTLLPNKMIQNATMKLFDSGYDEACVDSSPPLAYGDDTVYYRTRLADLLMQHSGRDNVNPDHLVVSNSSSSSSNSISIILHTSMLF
jgi:hypothetical protein